jgi:hypothetical protein
MKKDIKRFMQYQLVEKAVQEAGITNYTINIDHQNGWNYVNGVKLNLKYPKSFLTQCNQLNNDKKYLYGFKGGFTAGSADYHRTKLLQKYVQRPDSKVVDTMVGRKRANKAGFDTEYYQLLASSWFSLCPNWAGKWWSHDNAWTYRFIESMFARSLPIVFNETPLGKNFQRDFHVFENNDIHDKENYKEKIESNYKKAVNIWTLNAKEIKSIKKRS